jgi:ABC-2 type transport system ATP-binding protein
VIGRDAAADVIIADPEISQRHAALLVVDGGIAVEDLGSTNGTFVNGRRANAAQRLQPGDRLTFGHTVVEVRAPATAGPTPSTGLAPADVSQAKQIPTAPMLVFVAGPRAGTELPVGTQLVVGREAGAADVVIEGDPDVSRRHASFSPAGAGLVLQDLGSTNGTFVNGHRLDHAVTLGTGDQVQIGTTTIEVRLSRETVIEPVRAPVPVAIAAPGDEDNDIEAEGLVKEFDTRRAVDDVSLYVAPGEIYGFLGPNGAGKSTMVHMLTTLMPPTAGSARVAGYSVTDQGAQVRASIGAALQAAALDPQLNAWEHMDLQTALQGIPKSERSQRGAELLERMGLIDAAGRRVGGYSGGMKRRLDLALALVHRPRVLFLDEPTTGLDPQSRTALWEEVARLVREEGMTVFLTTQYLEEADVLADRVGIIDHGEIVAEDTPAALKAEIGRPTVEVTPLRSTDFAAVSDVLGRFGELASPTQRGVAVRLRSGADDLASVIRALDGAGLPVANVELHAPTLDDVFLAKTGRSLEGAGEDEQLDEEFVLDQLSGSVPLVTGPIPGE